MANRHERAVGALQKGVGVPVGAVTEAHRALAALTEGREQIVDRFVRGALAAPSGADCDGPFVPLFDSESDPEYECDDDYEYDALVGAPFDPFGPGGYDPFARDLY